MDGWGGEWSEGGDGGRNKRGGRLKDVGGRGNDADHRVATTSEKAVGEDLNDDLDDLVWSPSAVRRHRQLARVVTDWWDMLSVFGYL